MREPYPLMSSPPVVHFNPVTYNSINSSPPHYHSPHYSPPHYSPINISPPHYRQGNRSSDKIYSLEEGQKKYQELIQENLWLNQQIAKKRFGHATDAYSKNYQPGQRNGDKVKGDIILNGMIERNRYLQQKIEKLRKQQQRHTNSIRNIQHSEQWQTRHVCTPSRCYHQKYMQLLRIRSPFF